MDSLFEYDPPSWYADNPERQAEITAKHIKARREVGVSNWDLYNLNSYYSRLVFTLARESLTRDMGLSDEAKAEFSNILQSAYRIEELEKESDEAFDNLVESLLEEKEENSDKLSKIDNEQVAIYNKAMEMFIFDTLPKLPFKDGWVLPQANRDKHGLAQEDYEFIGSTMIDRLATGILKFQEYSSDGETNKVRSHPGNFTMDEWVAELGKMRNIILSLHPSVGKEYAPEERERFIKVGFSQLWI